LVGKVGNQLVKNKTFREDLFYRINTIEIAMPSLKDRSEDIHLLFRKFVANFSDKHNIPPIKLTTDAVDLIQNYEWPGNIRELKNFAEKISIIEEKRLLNSSDLNPHLASDTSSLIVTKDQTESSFSEREILYKILFELKNDLNDLKQITLDLIEGNGKNESFQSNNAERIQRIYKNPMPNQLEIQDLPDNKPNIITHSTNDENLSLQENECDIIQKSLTKNNGKRKIAARELGISERTLYRKIKQYNL